MKPQALEDVWLYTRAVLRQWWVIVVEGLLVLTDVGERIFGTWLLPSTRVKLGVGFSVLTIAQYRAYREVLLQSRAANEKKAGLAIYPEGRSVLYLETPSRSANSLGFYLELGLGVQNNGEQNSVIRKFGLEIQETGAKIVHLVPSPHSRIQTRQGQQMTQNILIVTQGNSIVVGAHNIRSGILPFYVPGDPGALPEKIRCKLRLEDTEGTSAEHTFTVPVVG